MLNIYRGCFIYLFFFQTESYLRLHVKQVTYSHIGVALAVTITLCEELVLSPGHVNPLGPTFSLVIYCGMRRCVSVMNELGLERRKRERWGNQVLTFRYFGEKTRWRKWTEWKRHKQENNRQAAEGVNDEGMTQWSDLWVQDNAKKAN